MAFLRRIKKALIRAMCGVRLIAKSSDKKANDEKRRSQEFMSLLGLKDILNGLARASV